MENQLAHARRSPLCKALCNKGRMNNSEWKIAKQYMLPYEGGATQIHLLSIPKERIEFALEVIETNVSNAKVRVVSSEPLEDSINLSKIIKEKIKIIDFIQGQSTITAEIFEIQILHLIFGQKKVQTLST